MLKFIRQSFSKRRRGNEFPSSAPTVASGKDVLDIHVILLDGESQKYRLPKNTLGDDLFDKVCFNLELTERDFFGLQYTDNEAVSHWLEPSKTIKKQVTIGVNNAFTLQFRVKFFPSQPNLVKEELTKYYFYWQLKQDVASGALPVPSDLAVELAALNVQSELGDFEAGEHDEITVSEFRFVPSNEQTIEFERLVLLNWKQLHGLNPAQCEDRYINKLKDVEMYGVSMHEVLGKDGNTYKLGLTPFGMLIYDGEERIGLFLWQKMEKLAFKKKQLLIDVTDTDPRGVEKLHVFQFTLRSSKVCKHVWKCAIEFHTFYRLQSSHSASVRPKQSFVRMQSKFRYSGRTEAQMRSSARAPQPRRQIQFQRRPSKRYSRRESHRIRERIVSQSQTNIESLNSSANTTNNVKLSSASQTSLNSPKNMPLSNASSSALGKGSIGELNRKTGDQNLIEFSPVSTDSRSLGYASYFGSSSVTKNESIGSRATNFGEERYEAVDVPEKPYRPRSGFSPVHNDSMSSSGSYFPLAGHHEGVKSTFRDSSQDARQKYVEHTGSDRSSNRPVAPPPRSSSNNFAERTSPMSSSQSYATPSRSDGFFGQDLNRNQLVNSAKVSRRIMMTEI